MRYRVYNRFETLSDRREKRFSNIKEMAEYYKELSLNCAEEAYSYLDENKEIFCYYKYTIKGDEEEDNEEKR